MLELELLEPGAAVDDSLYPEELVDAFVLVFAAVDELDWAE